MTSQLINNVKLRHFTDESWVVVSEKRLIDKSDFSQFSDSSGESDDTYSEDLSSCESDSSDIEEDATVSVLPLLEPHWSSSLQDTESSPVLSDFGPSHNLNHTNNERDYFNLIFDDRCVTVLTEETNRYSRETQEKTGK